MTLHPPLISVATMAVCRRRRATQINWLQDLYPEVARELGAPLLAGRLGTVLRTLRNRSLGNAACNVAIGTVMARRLETEGVAPATQRH